MLNIAAEPNQAVDFKLMLPRAPLDKFHRFPKSTTCLRRQPWSDAAPLKECE
jgi:hypothetical protein